MFSKQIDLEPIRWFDMPQIVRMTIANLGQVDQQLKRLLRGRIARVLVRLLGPFYLALGGRGYKAMVAGDIQGCAFLNLRRQSAYIYNVQVNENARRQGVGMELMLGVEQRGLLEGYQWAALFVDRSNMIGQKLYQKLGYRRYFGTFWRRRIPDGWPVAAASEVEVRAVRQPEAVRLFNTYSYHELLNGDGWAAAVVSNDYPTHLPRTGQYFLCTFTGKEIGFAWSEYVKNRPVIRLYLSQHVWGNDEIFRGLVSAIRLASGFRSSYLDLYLGSSAHNDAIADTLQELGFAEESQARLLLIKRLGEKAAMIN